MTYRPRFRPEGPAGACVLHGVRLGYAICTNLSFAAGIERATGGRVDLSGCQVRDETGDYSGGTTIGQNATVAAAHGVRVEQHVGSGVCSPSYAAVQLQAGRGISLAGNLSALMGTPLQSNGTRVNHNVWVNEVRGGTPGHPQSALVYDGMANGRTAGWGTAPNGPQWWPWATVLKYAAQLRPWGDNDSRLLGPGKFYCGIFPDTEGSLWGADVPADLRALDPDGRIVADAIRKTGGSFGTRIDLSDLKAALNRAHISYGSVVNPGDLAALLAWADRH